MMDFIDIVNVRQQFGNEDLNIGVFAGEEKEFSFDCPNVNSSHTAVLLFQGTRVFQEQALEINGSVVFGGIPSGPIVSGITSSGSDNLHSHSFESISFGWSGYVMLVSPNTLRDSNNVLRIAFLGGAEFIIDNMVLLYKTRGPTVERPDVVQDQG